MPSEDWWTVCFSLNEADVDIIWDENGTRVLLMLVDGSDATLAALQAGTGYIKCIYAYFIIPTQVPLNLISQSTLTSKDLKKWLMFSNF